MTEMLQSRASRPARPGASFTELWAEELCARFEAPLPEHVARTVGWALRDACGLALSGSVTSAGARVGRYVAEVGGSRESAVFGRGDRVPAAQAAFANGASIHALDFDDGHRMAGGHPGTVVVPAALAVGERHDASGSELLKAIALGYETFIRIGSAITPEHVRRGFHTTATVGALAAAVAAGLARGLGPHELANALSLATLQSGGLLEVVHDGAESKPFQVGRASASGVLAADMAAAGLEGPRTAMEGRHGWLAAVGGAPVEDIDTGEGWTLTQIYFKPHAACQATHAPIDALLALREVADTFDEVVVHTNSVAAMIVGDDEAPRGPSDAKFNLPFCLALAHRGGRVGPEEFDDAAVADPELQAFARRVRVVVDPDLDAIYPHRRSVRVVVRSGESLHEHFQEHAVGEPELPMDDARLREKFVGEAGRVVGDERAGELADMLERPEELTCRTLADALAGPPSARGEGGA